MLGIISRRSHGGILGTVHADGDPGENAIGQVIAQKDILHERIDGIGFLGENGILGVGGEILGISRIRGGLFDLGDEILVEEELADVGGFGGVEAGDGVVLEDGCLVDGMGEDWGGRDGIVSLIREGGGKWKNQ